MTQSHKASQTSEQKGITLDDLALMIKEGFDDIDGRFTVVDSRFDAVDKQLCSLEQGQVETNKRLAVLEDGQDQIKLRLDNVAYRFEVTELNLRVGRIEHKLGLA